MGVGVGVGAVVASCAAASCALPAVLTAAIELCTSRRDCQKPSFSIEFLPKKSLLNELRLFPTATAPDRCDGMVEKAWRRGIGVRPSCRQHCTHTVLASRPAIERGSPGRRLMAACASVAARRGHAIHFSTCTLRPTLSQRRSAEADWRRASSSGERDDYQTHAPNELPREQTMLAILVVRSHYYTSKQAGKAVFSDLPKPDINADHPPSSKNAIR